MKLTRSHLIFRKAAWPKKTYHATSVPYTYTVDFDGSRWVLRAWKDGATTQVTGYQYGDRSTVSALMDLSNAHTASANPVS